MYPQLTPVQRELQSRRIAALTGAILPSLSQINGLAKALTHALLRRMVYIVSPARFG
jgi:hypothetical protein